MAAAEAFGEGLLEDFPFAAYVSKTITLAPRAGNPPPRIWEVPAGMINSIGLPNKGLEGYLDVDLPRLAGITTRGHDPGGELRDVPLITNVMGSSAAELRDAGGRRASSASEIAAIELNVSCPNVQTGLDIGADPEQLRAVLGELRDATSKPLIVKLTPNAADVPACALAAEQGGADAVSLINTLRAMALAPAANGARARPWLGGTTGGLSGPAVRAVALAQVAAVARAGADPGDRDGRGPDGRPRARAAGGRREPGGGRDRVLPRSRRGAQDRARTAGAARRRCERRRYFSAVSGDAAGPTPAAMRPCDLAAEPR